MKMLTAAKLKLGFAALVLAGGATILMLQQHRQEKLRIENDSLQQQLTQLQADNRGLSNRIASAVDSQKLSDERFKELLKLRGEVGPLQNKVGVLAKENEALLKRLKDRAGLQPGSATNLAVAGQVHIKVRFISLPKGALAGFQGFLGSQTSESKTFTGVINDENLRLILKQFAKLDGVETLGEPEVVTTSGRQCQMRATTIVSVITNAMTLLGTNVALTEMNDTIAMQPVEIGPILDVVPEILPDGFMIALLVTASFTEFLGYDNVTNTTPAYTKTREIVNVPTVSPQFDVKETTASVNLWDNQTLVLKLSSQQTSAHVAMAEVPNGSESKTVERDTLVFVTATILDPAGNRVHTEEDDASHKDTIPSQSPPALPGQSPGASN